MNIKTRLKNLELLHVSIDIEPVFIRICLSGTDDEDILALELNGVEYPRNNNETYKDFQERVELLCDRTISHHIIQCIYRDKNE